MQDRSIGRDIRRIAIAVAVTFAAVQAMAAPSSARAFVESIYARYHGSSDTAHGIVLDRNPVIRRYFTPQLAALIIADEDQAARKNEVPALDGDAFVDAQDWDISRLAVAVEDQGPDRARATVSFRNFGDPKQVRLELVRLPSGWRIDDIVYPAGEGTLRGLYAKGR